MSRQELQSLLQTNILPGRSGSGPPANFVDGEDELGTTEAARFQRRHELELQKRDRDQALVRELNQLDFLVVVCRDRVFCLTTLDNTGPAAVTTPQSPPLSSSGSGRFPSRSLVLYGVHRYFPPLFPIRTRQLRIPRFSAPAAASAQTEELERLKFRGCIPHSVDFLDGMEQVGRRLRGLSLTHKMLFRAAKLHERRQSGPSPMELQSQYLNKKLEAGLPLTEFEQEQVRMLEEHHYMSGQVVAPLVRAPDEDSASENLMEDEEAEDAEAEDWQEWDVSQSIRGWTSPYLRVSLVLLLRLVPVAESSRFIRLEILLRPAGRDLG